MQRDFTATVYIIQKEKVLLHPHLKQGKWLPPGGHIEENESPPEAARREVMEESGLEIEFIPQENLWVNAPLAKSIERPFMCLLENIERPYSHQHIDFIYLARPIKEKDVKSPFQWFSFSEAMSLDLFPDTRQILKKIYDLLKPLKEAPTYL